LCAFLISTMRSTCTAHLIVLYLFILVISGGERYLWSYQQCDLSDSSHFIPLRSKYSPQHAVVWHPLSALFPQLRNPISRPYKIRTPMQSFPQQIFISLCENVSLCARIRNCGQTKPQLAELEHRTFEILKWRGTAGPWPSR
jgi:hypothetical protein